MILSKALLLPTAVLFGFMLSGEVIAQQLDCEGVLNGPALPGTPCDDGDPTTGNDTYAGDCTCFGLRYDCLGVPGGLNMPATPCDDNDPTTGGDTWDINCNCVGHQLDCEGTPNGTALPGTECDDKDPTTIDDTWDANCICSGTPCPLQVDAGPDQSTCNALLTLMASYSGAAECLDCCPNELLVGWDMDSCLSCNPNNTIYTEFQPDIRASCLLVTADILESTAGHSCIEGVNNSHRAVCIKDGNAFILNSTYEPFAGETGHLSEINYYIQNPLNSLQMPPCGTYVSGAVIPTYTITILVDGVIQYTATRSISQTWDYQVVDLTSIANSVAFVFTAPISLQVILETNDQSPNGFFDLDEFNIVGGACSTDSSFPHFQWSTGDTTQLISVQSPGSYSVTITDCSGCIATDSLLVTSSCLDCEGVPGGTALPGTPCDDGDPNTINDVYDLSCICAGTPTVVDCQGVPGGIALPGSPCDDGNIQTINDLYDSTCICTGELFDNDQDGIADHIDLDDDNDGLFDTEEGNGLIDTDGDGLIDSFDTDSDADNCFDVLEAGFTDSDTDGVLDGTGISIDGLVTGNVNGYTGTNPTVTDFTCSLDPDCLGQIGGPALPGTPCDDFDPNTGNDVFQADCTCIGELIDCLGVPGGAALPGTACDDGDPNTINDVYDLSCNCTGTPTVLDCQGVPGGSALPGTACDDGDPTTGNDIYQSDCSCVGELIDCLGLPGGTAVPGSVCDDGDSTTVNDVYGVDCICAGTQLPLDCENVPGGTALPGTSCDDGDPTTGNDIYQSDCSCVGELIDCAGIPGGISFPGSPCDDGNIQTINDVYDSTCVCFGILFDNDQDAVADHIDLDDDNDGLFDTEEGNGLIDTDGDGVIDSFDSDSDADACFDCLEAGFTDANTDGILDGTGISIDGLVTGNVDGYTGTNPTVTDFTCSLDPDCLGQIGGPALPGTPCDDFDPNTVNDVFLADCTCAGDTVDCEGIPGGPALPGTVCNDNDSLTVNDVWDPSCNCIGTPMLLDCAGVPGGNAVMDDCGVCNGNNDCMNDFTCYDLESSPLSDVEEAYNGNVYSMAGSLDLVYDSELPWNWRGNQLIGLHWNQIDVPSGAIITQAYVQFTASDTTNYNPCVIEIEAEANDNAATLSWVQYDVSSRAMTNNSVSWTPNDWNIVGESGPDQRTADISQVLQEVIDRPGWSSGNAIALFIHGIGGRQAYSVDQDESKSARLCISYSLNSTFHSPLQLSEQNEINVGLYPNPNRGDVVFMEIDNEFVETSVGRISITDLFGHVVHFEQFPLNPTHHREEVILTEDLAQGVYLVSLNVNGKSVVSRLVIQ